MASPDWGHLVAFEIMATRFYSTAVAVLLFYDYLITLQDEVQYVWRGEKSWVFFVFLLNRYVPIIYEIWSLIAFYDPGYSEKNIIVEVIFLVFVTLLAQIFLVARLYALAKRKRRILVVFAFLAVVHVALGVVSIVPAANAPFVIIPLGPINVCILDSPVTFIFRATYNIFSLAYDTVLFLTLTRVSYSTCGPRSTWPTILKTIVRDSALYFLGVLASHFLVALFMMMDPSGMKYFSSVGINPLTPVMVSRLVLSLRKAANRRADVPRWISENISFGPNPELAARTQTHIELLDFPSRRTSVSSDTRAKSSSNTSPLLTVPQ